MRGFKKGGFHRLLPGSVLFLPLGLSACTQLNIWLGITDPWAGYTLSTANFIADKPFAVPDPAVASNTPAVWTWAWADTSLATDATSYAYMTLTSAGTVASLGATVPTGLSPTAGAWLLDLPNLLPPADSDFEGQSAGASPSANWSLDPPATATSIPTMDIKTGANSISGTASLGLDLKAKVGASLRLATILDSATATGTHAYQVRIHAFGSLHDSIHSWGSPLSGLQTLESAPFLSNSSTAVANTRLLFESDFTTENKALFFGFTNADSGTIDDLRVIRSDLASSYRLRLLLRPTDTTPSLAVGKWSFVVWVLVPKDAAGGLGRSFVTDAASAANPYAASTVTLSMDEIAAPLAGFSQEFPLDATARTEWQRLELRMPTASTTYNENYAFDVSSTSAVIELAIFPTSRSSPDPGGILIAQPELHFHLGGY